MRVLEVCSHEIVCVKGSVAPVAPDLFVHFHFSLNQLTFPKLFQVRPDPHKLSSKGVCLEIAETKFLYKPDVLLPVDSFSATPSHCLQLGFPSFHSLPNKPCPWSRSLQTLNTPR